MKKRSTLSWVLEFAGRKKFYFLLSVILAILGVAMSFVPYLLTADIVRNLLSDNRDWNYYLRLVVLMGICWVIRLVLQKLVLIKI